MYHDAKDKRWPAAQQALAAALSGQTFCRAPFAWHHFLPQAVRVIDDSQGVHDSQMIQPGGGAMCTKPAGVHASAADFWCIASQLCKAETSRPPGIKQTTLQAYPLPQVCTANSLCTIQTDVNMCSAGPDTLTTITWGARVTDTPPILPSLSTAGILLSDVPCHKAQLSVLTAPRVAGRVSLLSEWWPCLLQLPSGACGRLLAAAGCWLVCCPVVSRGPCVWPRLRHLLGPT